jgi:hypothetical protein
VGLLADLDRRTVGAVSRSSPGPHEVAGRAVEQSERRLDRRRRALPGRRTRGRPGLRARPVPSGRPGGVLGGIPAPDPPTRLHRGARCVPGGRPQRVPRRCPRAGSDRVRARRSTPRSQAASQGTPTAPPRPRARVASSPPSRPARSDASQRRPTPRRAPRPTRPRARRPRPRSRPPRAWRPSRHPPASRGSASGRARSVPGVVPAGALGRRPGLVPRGAARSCAASSGANTRSSAKPSAICGSRARAPASRASPALPSHAGAAVRTIQSAARSARSGSTPGPRGSSRFARSRVHGPNILRPHPMSHAPAAASPHRSSLLHETCGVLEDVLRARIGGRSSRRPTGTTTSTRRSGGCGRGCAPTHSAPSAAARAGRADRAARRGHAPRRVPRLPRVARGRLPVHRGGHPGRPARLRVDAGRRA